MLRSTFSTISRDIVEKAYVPICRRFARFQSRLRRYVGSVLFPLANTIPVRWRIKCVAAADPANIQYVCTFCQRTIKILISMMIDAPKKYRLRLLQDVTRIIDHCTNDSGRLFYILFG